MKLSEIVFFNDLPPKPGTSPIKAGNVRLYHQTEKENIDSIRKKGLILSYAKGIEGPRAIYAGETPFYGKIENRPTIEFQVPKNMWDDPFVLCDITPADFIGIHEPWHHKARYILENPEILNKTLAGEFDDLDGDYIKAVEYIKTKYPRSSTG